MADLNYIPREPTPRPVPGGPERKSVLVAVDHWPRIAARLDLERRLLDATCPHGEAGKGPSVSSADLDLLLLISHERFGGAHALLRAQAIRALPLIDDAGARARLSEIAFDPAEPDGLRLAAIYELDTSDDALVERLKQDPSDAIRAAAERLRDSGKCRDVRHATPRQVPGDATAADDELCCCIKLPR
jgi:hypothetical protein